MKKRIFEGKVALENGEIKTFDNIVEYNEFVNKLIRHGEMFDASTKTYMTTVNDEETEKDEPVQVLSYDDIVDFLATIHEKISDKELPNTSSDKQVEEFRNYCNELGEDFEKIITNSKINENVDFSRLAKSINEPILTTSNKMEATDVEINRLYDRIETCNVRLKYYDIILNFYKALKNYLKTRGNEILPGKPNDDICSSRCVTEPVEVKLDDEKINDTYSGIMKLIDAIKKEDNEKGVNVNDPFGLEDFFKSLGIKYKK